MSASEGWAVVTGASSGIGREIAVQLAERGYDLLVTADDDGLEQAATELRLAGTRVEAVPADLATYDGVEDLVEAVAARGVPLDVLVLNAGVGNGGPFLETSLDGDLEVIGVNVTAVVHLSKRLIPAMVARGQGRVLITASTASVMPGPYYATYAASKAFDLSFAEGVRHELRDTGVTVTALMPGPTDTAFFERADMEQTTVGQGPKDDPAKVATEGLDGLFAGKDKVVVGSMKARSQTAMASVMPDRAKAATHGKMAEPHDD